MKTLALLVICFSISLISSCSVQATKFVKPTNLSETNNKNPIQKIKLIPKTYKNEKLIWKGETDDYKVFWTKKDIYVEKDGKTKKLFTNFAQKYYDLSFKYQSEYSEKLGKFIKTKKLSTCDISIDGQIISLIGNYLTLEVEEFYVCGIIQYYTHWIIFDLDNTDSVKFVSNKYTDYHPKGVKITDLFDDKEILLELLKNPEIDKTIKAIDKNFKPSSTAELLQWFQDKEEKYYENMGESKQSFEFEDIAFENLNYSFLTLKALTEFNIIKIVNSKALVQIALAPHGKQHGLQSIEIKLNIPQKMQAKLNSNSLKKVNKTDNTEIYFDVD